MSNSRLHRTIAYIRGNALPAAREYAVIARSEARRFFRYLRGHLRRIAKGYSSELNSIVKPCGDVTRRRVRRHAVLLGCARIVEHRLATLSLLATLTVLIAVPTVLIKVVRSRAALDLGIVPFEDEEQVGALVGSLLVLLLMFPPLPSGRYFRTLFGSPAFLGLWAAAVFIFATVMSVLALPWHPVLSLAFLIPCVLVTAMRGVVVASAYGDTLVAMAYPDHFPLKQLLIARRLLSPHDRTLAEIRSRAAVVRELEAAAAHITTVWPRQVRPMSVANKEWFFAQCRNVASYFAAVEREILWTNTYHVEARDSLDTLIRTFVEGTVNELSFAPQPDVSMPARYLYAERIKSFIISIVPLGTLYMLHLATLPIPSVVLPWLTLVAYTWALIGLLTIVDPLLERRIALSRGLLDLFKLPSRN